MDCKLKSDHPLVHWMIEHAATVYNKYAVTPECKTPCANLQGKIPKEKRVGACDGMHPNDCAPSSISSDDSELMWAVPFLLMSITLRCPNGSVLKSRSIVRVVPSGRWDQKTSLAVKGIPGNLTLSDDYEDVDLETSPETSREP